MLLIKPFVTNSFKAHLPETHNKSLKNYVEEVAPGGGGVHQYSHHLEQLHLHAGGTETDSHKEPARTFHLKLI
jgi:hypothetical protein